ncbi:CHC2 zinc finger domain-containing protein [Prolixibacter denitrificans]|jgi:DNA primase|uniref:CHC2-type zinc finger protein n=1 Tax=Prolixibacter denitrificans TaxID=1541063 RepID=A0A2P8CDP6_9BACT|nr:CHC2-type zinc finger protein [Prolixibacter denitrificans]
MLCFPFHEYDTLSVDVYSDTNRTNCFGCGANGGVIGYVLRSESYSKRKRRRWQVNKC